MDTITLKAPKNPPCRFSAEELKAEVEKSVRQHKEGKTTTQEEVFEQIEKLLIE